MERDSRQNISHKKMPTYNQHMSFVSSKPYSKWYVILYGMNKVGSIYLTSQNEIGIFIKKSFQNMQIGDTALREIIKKNPKNKKSIQFFKNHGFKLIQYTFELSKN